MSIEEVKALNDEIQEFVSTGGADLPAELLKLLSDLDWALRERRKLRKADRDELEPWSMPS